MQYNTMKRFSSSAQSNSQ